jgi:hypothetical protein
MTKPADQTPRRTEPADDGVDVRTLARGQTQTVIDALTAWVESDNDRASLAAATILLDRGWGKVEGRADPTTAPITVIRAPMVAEDTEAWQQQYAPPAAR